MDPSNTLTECLDSKRVEAFLCLLPPGTHRTLDATLAPCGAHLLLFGEFPSRDCTKPDGHSLHQLGQPDESGLVRMYAGGRISFETVIPRDAMVTRTEGVAGRDVRDGRSGRLYFVTVDATYTAAQAIVVQEQRTIVYRKAAPYRAMSPTFAPPCETVCRHAFDAVDLFRFSALSFNSHRIHYDADYARMVEQYPGLVVQGPLLAATLLGLADSPKSLVFRLIRPSFEKEVLAFSRSLEDPEQWFVVGPDASVRVAAKITQA